MCVENFMPSKSRKLGGNKDKLSFLGPSRNEEIMKPAALTLV